MHDCIGFGVDAIAMRDSSGHLIIPGDQIQGKVREALDEIGREFDTWDRRKEDVNAAAERGLTKPDNRELSEEYSTNQKENLDNPAKRYPVQFSDFRSIVACPPPGQHTITQIETESEDGAAAPGMLRVLDAPLLPGQPMTFVGTVRFIAREAKDAQENLERIINALKWIPSFGSNKSVGFGRLERVDWHSQCVTKLLSRTVIIRHAASHRFVVDFTFQDSVCVPEGVANGNIFETRSEIPGEVLKGAVAGLIHRVLGSDSLLPDFPQDLADASPLAELCRWFCCVRITTARPQQDSAKPILPAVIPKSLAIAKDRVFDFALLPESEEQHLFEGDCAAFIPDWKGRQFTAIENHFDIVRPGEELRVHTAIDSDQRRAKKGQLFAFRSMRPEGYTWRASISIDGRISCGKVSQPTAKECDQVVCQLLSLLQNAHPTTIAASSDYPPPELLFPKTEH